MKQDRAGTAALKLGFLSLAAMAQKLIDELPRCGHHVDEDCSNRAEYICFDAAGDMCYRCEDHKFTGGMLGDDAPVELKYADTVRKIEQALKDE